MFHILCIVSKYIIKVFIYISVYILQLIGFKNVILIYIYWILNIPQNSSISLWDIQNSVDLIA